MEPTREERAESAVRAELVRYRSAYSLRLLRALSLAVVGALMAFFLPVGPTAFTSGSWLVAKLGPAGASLALRGLGVAVLVAALLWGLSIVRALTQGRHRFEAELRRQVGLGSDG